MKKIFCVFTLIAAALLIALAAALSVSAAEPALLFRFDENWEYYCYGPWFLHVSESEYDPAEKALKFITEPWDDDNPDAPHYMLQADLAEDFVKLKKDYGWAVICMKRPSLSPSFDKNPNRKIEVIGMVEDENGVAKSAAFVAQVAGETGGEYKTYAAKFGDRSVWNPAPENVEEEDVERIRISLFGPAGGDKDYEGGSVAYLRYVAIFDNEADARAFAEAHPDGLDLAGIEPPTSPPPVETTETPTAGDTGSDDGDTAAPLDNTGENDAGEGGGGFNIWLIAGIAAAVILIAVVVFIMIKKGGRKENAGK